MPLIADTAPTGWKPRVGELVRGRKGKRDVVGVVLADERRPERPRLRAFRSGFVAYFVSIRADLVPVPVNNVQPERAPW